MTERSLVANVAELVRQPGSRRHLVQSVPAAAVDAEHPAITGSVTVDLTLESTLDDVVVSGTLHVPWHGTCRRCLVAVARTLEIDVEERYAEAPELVAAGEALPIERLQIDLTGLVRDEVLLAVAEERLCREDCAGLCTTCGADLNDGACECVPVGADDRWSVLDQLRGSD